MSRADKSRVVIAVTNLKGGTGKTTTAVYLAHALHEQGRRVLLVDADPQASAIGWNEVAPDPFPFPVIGLASKDLHRQLGDVVRSEVNAVVIDTPPLDQKSGIVLSAMRAATLAVVPVAPSPMETERLEHVRELAQDVAGLRPDGRPLLLAVLLSRTIARASSTLVVRDQLKRDGYWCLESDVRRLEQFAQAYGDNVTNALETAYGVVIDELLKEVAA